MKKSREGFTLAELLIVIAIIAVLVAVAIPLFGKQLEKSREATDLANVRAAYAEVMAEAITGNYAKEVVVDLKQKQSDWQSADVITIGGISHQVGTANTDNWIGIPGAGGQCKVSYDTTIKKDGCEVGAKFEWSDGGTSSANQYNMKEDFFQALEKSNCMSDANGHFEFDSTAKNSKYIPKIEEQIGSNSLMKDGTWAYMGNGKDETKRYFLWTSFDTTKVGEEKTVPIIVQKGDKYYVSSSKTSKRDKGHIAITAINYQGDYENIIKSGTLCKSLSEAYAVYEKELKKDKYKELLSSSDQKQ